MKNENKKIYTLLFLFCSCIIKYNFIYCAEHQECLGVCEIQKKRTQLVIIKDYNVIIDIYYMIDKNVHYIIENNYETKNKTNTVFNAINSDEKKVFRGLERYLFTDYFKPIFEFACVVLSIKQGRHDYLNERLKYDIEKITQIETQESSCFNFGIDLKKNTNCFYYLPRNFFGYLIQLEMLNSISYAIYLPQYHISIIDQLKFQMNGQIDAFFDDKILEKNRQELMTYRISDYLKIMNLRDAYKYRFEIKSHLKYITRYIDCYFEHKLSILIAEKGNFYKFKLSLNHLNKRLEYKNGLSALYFDYDSNLILEEILTAIYQNVEETIEPMMYEIEIRYDTINQFLLLCESNEETKEICSYVLLEKIEIIYIKNFYDNLCIDLFKNNAKTRKYGAFIFLTVILRYWKGDKYYFANFFNQILKSMFECRLDLDLDIFGYFLRKIKYNFEDFALDDNISLIIDGYCKLLSKHVDYSNIDKKIKETPEKISSISELVEEVLPRFFSESDKLYIEYQILKMLCDGKKFKRSEKQNLTKYIKENKKFNMILEEQIFQINININEDDYDEVHINEIVDNNSKDEINKLYCDENLNDSDVTVSDSDSISYTSDNNEIDDLLGLDDDFINPNENNNERNGNLGPGIRFHG